MVCPCSSSTHFLQPFQLKNLTLRNRVVSTSHEPSYTEDGMPKRRYRLYHEEKAKGGIGLTMMGGSAVVAPDSPAAFGNLHVYKDEIVPWLRELAYGVHENGAAVMCQITHLGRRTSNYDGDWLPVIAPSAIREPAHRAFPKVAEEWDMDRIVQRLRRRDGAMPRGGPGRNRTRGLHPSARLVLVAVDQPSRRRIRDGQPRGPTSVPAAGDSRRA